MLRKAGKRTVEALWEEVGVLLDTVSPMECRHYFASCGYVHICIENALMLQQKDPMPAFQPECEG